MRQTIQRMAYGLAPAEVACAKAFVRVKVQQEK